MDRNEQQFFDHRNAQESLSEEEREIILSATRYLQQFEIYLRACSLRDKIKRLDPARDVNNIPFPEKLSRERFELIQQASFILARRSDHRDASREDIENIKYFYFKLSGACIATHGTSDGANFENLKDDLVLLCPKNCEQVDQILKNQSMCN